MGQGLSSYIASRLASLWRSPALRSAAGFAAGGIGFALGNIFLARALPPDEYGYVVLFLALVQLGVTLGPMGLDTTINRHRIGASGAVLGRAALTATLAGLGIAAVTLLVYDIPITLALLLALAACLAALNRVGCAFLQSRQQFRSSLYLMLIHNWIFALVVPFALFMRESNAESICAVMTAGYAMTAIIGWGLAWRQRDGMRLTLPHGILTREGLNVVGLYLATSFFQQLDRLLIPRVLSIGALATYSVAASLAGAPYNMLKAGAGYTLAPQLRTSRSSRQMLSLIWREALALLAIVAVGSTLVIAFTPWLADVIFGGRYRIPLELMYAIVAIGILKIWHAMAAASVAAIGSPRELALLNAASWLAVGVASFCAIAESDGGLVAVLYGFAAGWLVLALVATVLAILSVRQRRQLQGTRSGHGLLTGFS